MNFKPEAWELLSIFDYLQGPMQGLLTERATDWQAELLIIQYFYSGKIISDNPPSIN